MTEKQFAQDLRAIFELLERTLDHGTLDPDSRIDVRAAYDRVGALCILNPTNDKNDDAS